MNADPMVVAAASVVIVGAVAAAAVTIIKAVGSAKVEILTVSNQVHALVNGSASEAAKKLTSLEAQIAQLHTTVAQLQERRVEDAKTRAAGE